MDVMMIAAIICYSIATLIAYVFFFIYLIRSEFLPYHREAVQQDWEELDPKHQALILALMRGAAGGWLGIGIAMTFLIIYPLQSGQRWALFAAPLIGLAGALSALYATLILRRRTSASPPTALVAACVILIIFGFIFSLI